jgi:hypothetical protein
LLRKAAAFGAERLHRNPGSLLNFKIFLYRNFDNELKTNRWFAKYEIGSDRFGEQVRRIKFQEFDSLEAAQAFCEKNALDVALALHDGEEPPGAPSI